ncbi:MAG: glycosyltransferase [uncultured bacterium]|nr:MAG: glycosyltransferase [uncultured bacterium]
MRESLIIRVLEKIELSLYRHSNKIIVVSPSFKENLVSRNVNAEKIFTIMNGVDLSRFSPKPRSISLAKKYNIADNKFVIGYIGTHGMAHALDNVLKTASLLQNEKNILFMFVGTGAEREALIEKARNLQLTNILFIPAQPKETISDYWSLCNVALVHFKNTPIFSVSIPSKIFEAMGMGLPILLASPKGAASDIVLNENVGLWVPAEDPTALADAVIQLNKKPGLLAQFSKISLDSAQHHTREAQARNFLDALDFKSISKSSLQYSQDKSNLI